MNEKFHKDCYSLADHCTCNLLLLLKMLRPRSWTIWFWMQMAKLKNLFFLGFGTNKWDSRVPARVVWAVVEVLKKLWGILVEFGGDLLLRVVQCSTYSMLTIFPFTSDSKAKCHSQPLPQCLPSVKQNNRWLDLEVSYLTYLAVVFCFVMVLGYELEVIPAALASSLPTDIKIAWFSHYYLLRLLLHVHLLCLGDPKLCM